MTNTYLKAACLGVVAGMRSMTAPFLTSTQLSRTHPDDLEGTPLAWFVSAPSTGIFTFLALGELAADKLPAIPARTDPGPLAGRAATGALSGAAVCVAEGEGMVEGALIGAVAAVASAHLFYRLRRWLGQATPLPDPALAVMEDALALGIGRSALTAGAAE